MLCLGSPPRLCPLCSRPQSQRTHSMGASHHSSLITPHTETGLSIQNAQQETEMREDEERERERG